MMKNPPLLTRAQCSVLRGIAIIGIFLHNFCHWLPGVVTENEYMLDVDRSRRLLRILAHPDALLPVHLLSFFGHYGVPLFVFLSGFGLVLKYENRDFRVGRFDFMTYNYLKLFRMLVVGLIIFYIASRYETGTRLVASHLLMVVNLFSYGHWIVTPGPFWFFGFMLQLYVLYRFVIYHPRSSQSSRWGWLTPLVLIAAVFAGQAFLAPAGDMIGYLRLNFVAGVMPLCLGVLAARYGSRLNTLPRWAWWITLAVSVVAVWLTNYSFLPWLWSGAFVVSGAVAGVKLLGGGEKNEQGKTSLATALLFRPLDWVGACSAFIFMMHPTVRFFFFHNIDFQAGDTPTFYATLAAYAVITIIASWLLMLAMRLVPLPTLKTQPLKNE